MSGHRPRWPALLVLTLATLMLLRAAVGRAQEASEPLQPTHGVASGDVGPTSAVVWVRASRAATVRIAFDADPAQSSPREAWAQALPETHLTAQVRLDDLRPDTTYHYYVWLDEAPRPERPLRDAAEAGTFRTAPSPDAGDRAVRFVIGGNLGGQRYCRRVNLGYPIFGPMAEAQPDFFVANGDLIYATWDCPAEGPPEAPDWRNVAGDFPSVMDPSVSWTDLAQLREVYHQHWRYNRADGVLQGLLRTVPVYAQWDDNEVVNDFGAGWAHLNLEYANRDGFPNLVQAGREAFFAYWPIDRHPDEPDRIYRSFRWGKHLELFLLDARSYRDRNEVADSADNQKTLLGSAQLAWLAEGLERSTATWKVVSTDVPLSIPTGSRPSTNGRDGWANGTTPGYSIQTGFERELIGLLWRLDRANVQNLVFVTTDVLYATNLRHRLDLDDDGDQFEFHQLASGPLSARREDPRELDPTLRPTLLYAEGSLFNFGYARVEPDGQGSARFVYEVRGEDGQPRPGSRLDLPAR